MLYFSKIQDDSYQIIAPISCIMASFHKLNQTDIVGCVAKKLLEKIRCWEFIDLADLLMDVLLRQEESPVQCDSSEQVIWCRQ